MVTQLAESMQQAVTKVEVDWSPLRGQGQATEVVTLERSAGAVQHSADSAEGKLELQRFVSQGGVRTLQPVEVDLPAVAAGGRLLAMALLGASASTASVAVKIFMGDEVVSVKVTRSLLYISVHLFHLLRQST